MIRKTIVRTITLVALTGFMTACNHEDYEEGEGSLSYLYADYADITIAGGEVISIITDDNAQLTLPQNLMDIISAGGLVKSMQRRNGILKEDN